MRKILVLICATIIVGCAGCSGGGGGAPNQPIQPDPDTTAALSSAMDFLASGDVTGAEGKYTDIINNNPTNAEARFGRALTKIILLMEREPTLDILAGLNGGTWSVATIFGDNGFLYTDNYNALPFYDRKSCYDNSFTKPFGGLYKLFRKDRAMRCLLGGVQQPYRSSNVIESVIQYTPYLDSINEDLLVAIGTVNATFTTPKALYNGDADIEINHADMLALVAGMYATEAGIELANSWSFDVWLSSLFDSTGKFIGSRPDLVESLNASFVLKNPNYVSNAKNYLAQALLYNKSALEEVLNGSVGGVNDLSEQNKEMYTEMLEMVRVAQTSMSSNSNTVAPYVYSISPITGNLFAFFEDPPSADAISYDPFVLEKGRIKIVEAFWQEFMKKYCNIDVASDLKIKVFSLQVRNIKHPFRLLFDEIIGRKFGVDHYAGKKDVDEPGAGGGSL